VGEAGGVRRLQHVKDVKADLGDPLGRQRAVLGDQLVEGERLQQLGGHVDAAVLGDHVAEADHPRVAEAGRRPHLAGDLRPELRPFGVAHPGRQLQLLDRQRRAAFQVGGAPDDAGVAAAERGLQTPAACDEPLGGIGRHPDTQRYVPDPGTPKTASEQRLPSERQARYPMVESER
jgi:hypothetical protein